MKKGTCVVAGCLSLVAGSAAAQDAEPILPDIGFRAIDIATDSGLVRNDTDQGEIVYSTDIRIPKTSWIRLEFGNVKLAGEADTASESLIVITSLHDGATQYLNSRHVAEWQNTSAYFNGDAVRVEIFAAPGTGDNRLEILSAAAGELDQLDTRSICGPTDDRLPSNEARDARYLPAGCTAWLISEDRCMLSAGHCVASPGVIQFNVPFSNPDGSIVNPPPEDQYSIDPASMQSTGGATTLGNDWAYFGVFNNSNTGLPPFDVQGDLYDLAPSAPAVAGQTIRITGYGVVSSPISPTWNQIQKTHTGAYTSNSGTILQYTPDTTGGNSGSAVLDESTGLAIGIHTNAGCTSTGGANQGCSISNAGLQAALADPQGVCRFADCNNNGTNDYDEITNGTAFDCDNDGVLDECELAAGAPDCNNNLIPDSCDITPPGLELVDTETAVNGWIDITGTGTAHSLSDDGEATVNTGFSNLVFTSSDVTIGNNGAIGFLGGANLHYVNAGLPSGDAFGTAQALLPFWDDIDSDTGNVYSETVGAAPNRTFVVTWHDRPHFSGNTTLDGDEATFQVQVFETPVGGVSAQFLYQDTDFLDPAYNDGASATIGYQAGDGTANMWSFNTAGSVTPSTVLSLVPSGVATSQDQNGNGVPDECESGACSPADVTTAGAASGDPGFGVPDGQITASDLNYFVNAWTVLDASIADVTTAGAASGDPGFGVPDGQVTAADLNYFVNLWLAGCP